MALYVTHYSKYPIFEPAEGGYYYEGIAMESSVQCATLEKALKKVERLANEFDFKLSQDGRYAHSEYSKYIGEGEYIVIESRRGVDVSGYQPYC